MMEGKKGGMIVAGLQMDIVWEDPPSNYQHVREMVDELIQGSETPPDLLVLPEMFATGFSMNAASVSGFASETRAFLSDLAANLSISVLGGYAEKADPLPANACSIFDAQGNEKLHFRKLHPFSLAKEEEHYRGGDSVESCVVGGVRVTPLICYDLRFPEPFRPSAPGTDLFCVIANWPEKRREAWSTLLRARAIENQAYVLGVNRVGMAGNEPHSGDSALIGPMGEVVAECTPFQEEFVVGPVKAEEVKRVRRRLSFLKDRRPKLYGRLEKAAE